MRQYSVTGMRCAACSARVEKAVSAVQGVTDCTVNLLTGSMQVEGTALTGTVSSPHYYFESAAMILTLITAEPVTDFEAVPGRGLRGKYRSKELLGGNSSFIGQTDVQSVTEQGKTPLLFSLDGQYLDMLAVADTLRTDSAEAVAQLQKMGIRVVMLPLTTEKRRRGAKIVRWTVLRGEP